MPASFRRHSRSRGGQSAGAPAGTPPASLCTHSQTHHPACTLQHSTHRAIRSDLFLFLLIWGKKKKLDNDHIGIKCKTFHHPPPPKIQSAQSREAISTCGHTLLPCFMHECMTFIVGFRIQLGLCYPV